MKLKKIVFSVIVIFTLLFTLGFKPSVSVEAATGFKDVTNKHWAKKEIDYLSGLKIINGMSDGTFKPNDYVTNAQIAIMMAKALKSDLNDRPEPSLPDVTAGTFGYKEITALVDEGIIENNVPFKPNAPATRETMAMVLAKAFKVTGVNHVNFTDVGTKHPSFSSISAVAANNIASGYTDGTFKPQEKVTRAQFSVFVARALNTSLRPTATVVRGVNFGMTIKQVQGIEKAKLINKDVDGTDTYLTYQLKKYGYNSNLVYVFEKGKLTQMFIDFLPTGNDNLKWAQMVDLHNKLQKVYINELGAKFSTENDKKTEIYTTWEKGFYSAELVVDNVEGYTQAYILYSK